MITDFSVFLKVTRSPLYYMAECVLIGYHVAKDFPAFVPQWPGAPSSVLVILIDLDFALVQKDTQKNRTCILDRISSLLGLTLGQ